MISWVSNKNHLRFPGFHATIICDSRGSIHGLYYEKHYHLDEIK